MIKPLWNFPKRFFVFKEITKISMEELFDIIIHTFGYPKNKSYDTGQISVDCPYCDDGCHKGNLEINVSQNIYSCWACRDLPEGVKGRDIKWLIRKYGTIDDFREYAALVPTVKVITEKKVNQEVILPKEYKSFHKKNSHLPGYKEALSYLTDRGLSLEIIQNFFIGFCNDGKYQKRIIIPSFDEFGNINYFLGRDWTGRNKIPYLNHSNSKQDITFNEYFIDYDFSVTLVEGTFDHFPTFNSIPLLGKDISPKLTSKLQKNLKGNLYILFDGDALKQAKELQSKLNFGALRGRVYIIQLPSEEDPSSLYKKLGSLEYYKFLKDNIILQ